MPCDQITKLEKPAQSVMRLFLASAMLVLSPLAASASATHNSTAYAGIYVARVAKTAPSMTVSLGEDGTATVTGDLGKGAVTYFGAWEDNGRQIKVTFRSEDGNPAPPPMIFESEHNKLQAVSWDRGAWGNAQPPIMTKGYKVKYLFWSTSMR